MTQNEFANHHRITDSYLLSFQIEYDRNRNHGDTAILKFLEKKFLPNRLEVEVQYILEFYGLLEFYFNESFPSTIISQSTFTKTTDGNFYLSLDPWEEDSPSDKDNMIIRCSEVVFVNQEGARHKIT